MDMDKTALGTMEADERTQMVTTPVSNATQMAMNIECPVCRTKTPPSEAYCVDCGFLLSSTPASVSDVPEASSIGMLVSTDGMREFPLNPGANTVGRENADVLLAHNTVSRMHATVTVEGGRAYVEDAGSTNGSYVSGKRIAPDEKADLTDGCDVTFGSYALKYQAPAEPQVASAEQPEAEFVEKTEMIAPAEAVEEPGEQTFDLQEPEVTPEVETGAEAIPATQIVGRLVSKDGAVSLDIHEGTNTVGRREGDNDIVVPDPYSSGRHADLLHANGTFTITDIGSTNGTLVNGVKLEISAPRDIQVGDEITLGRTVFRLEVA